MNESEVLNKAADMLEEGWCTGTLAADDGRICAVGAIAAVEFGLTREQIMLGDPMFISGIYTRLDESPVVKALADFIGNEEGYPPADVVYTFNDKQTEPGPVAALFRQVAKEQSNG